MQEFLEINSPVASAYANFKTKMIGEIRTVYLAILKSESSSIKQLRILWSELDDTSCYLLSLALPELKDLKEVTLRDNLIGPPQFNKFKNSLSYCKHLQKLCICQNNLGDDGVASLSEVLRNLPNLQQLVLEDNAISDKGVESLAKVLPQLASLRVFWVHKNQITGKGLAKLSRALSNLENFEEFYFDTRLADKTIVDHIQSQVPRVVLHQDV